MREPTELSPPTMSPQTMAPLDKFMLDGKELTPRWLLQWIGTDLCRKLLSDTIWIDATALIIQERMRKVHPVSLRIAVTDVRFPNEAELLPEKLIKLETACFRVRITDPTRSSAEANSHASESSILHLPKEFEITNDKHRGLAPLHRALDRMIDQFVFLV